MITGSSEGMRFEAGEGTEPAAGLPSRAEREGPSAADPAEEVARLEALLSERARQVQALRSDLGHARHLLREASARFEETAQAAALAAPSELAAQRDRAAARALEAEAARAELAFRIDELLGHVATAAGDIRAPADGALELNVARLSGTARGLRAALAEAEEARDTARARLLLLEQDFGQQKGRERSLERALSEAREQAELELSRARGLAIELARAPSVPTIEVLRGELAGLRARSVEAERAFELSAGSASKRIPELSERLEREIETGREVRAELARAVAEQMVLREELARSEAERSATRQRSEQAHADESNRIAALEHERDAARRESEAKREWAARMAEALRDGRALLRELGVALGRVGTAPASAIEAGDESLPLGARSSVPPGIEALEGLEERITLRDQRITDLSAQLAYDRGRIAAVVHALNELRSRSPAETLSSTELDSVLALLIPR